jgi:predicted N-acetyltransferase YhbS
MLLSVPTSADRADIETLLDLSFGADRHGRTAYRLREDSHRLDALGLIARDGCGALLGSIEFWPLEIVEDGTGAVSPAILLGPIAVAPTARGQGLGGLLVRAGLDTARTLGIETVVLIGDPDYYSRFGFTSSQTGGWRLPGPFESHRLLALTLTPGLVLPAPASLRGARTVSSAPLGEPGRQPQPQQA